VSSSLILFLSVLVLCIFIMITKVITGSVLSINIIYSLLWIIIMFLSINNALGLLAPRKEIYWLIFASIIVFNIIYLLLHRKKKNSSKEDNNYYFVNERKLWILNFVSYVLVFPFIIKALGMIISNGFDLLLIRNTIYVGITESDNAFVSIFCRTIPTAIFIFTELVSSYYLICKKNKKVILLGLVDVLVGTLIFGGRNFLLNYILFYVFHYLNTDKGNKIKIKKRYILLVIVLLFLVTKNRDVSGISFVQTIILYFAGSLSFLEYMLCYPSMYGLNSNYYGLLTFGFITEPLILLTKFLGFNYQVPSYYFNIHAQKFVDIGITKRYLYNNNSTFFYPFMLDFGMSYAIVGVILYVIIISVVDRMKNKGNLKFYMIFIYLCSTVLNSSISYKLIGLSSSVIIALSLFIIERKKADESGN